MQERRALATELPLKAVLRDHPSSIALSMLLTWLLTAVVVVAILMMPALLERGGIDRETALAANCVAIVCAMVGNLVAGALADRFGEGRMLAIWNVFVGAAFWLLRSEEHTSELQSLMRISYAVFCLKKKKKQ